jgi:hypothetical protein
VGAESFSCPHCNAVAHQDWFSLFLKPEKGTDVVVVTLEAAFMLVNAQDGDQKESELLTDRLRNNVVTYEYQKHARNLKVKLVNVHVSTCANCRGFTLWVRDEPVFPGRIEEAPYIVLEGIREPAEEVRKGTAEHDEAVVEQPKQVAQSIRESPEKQLTEELEEDFEEAAAILNKSPGAAAALMRLCIHHMMPLLAGQGKTLDENVSSLVRKGLEVEIQQSMDMLRVLCKYPFQAGNFEWKEDNETATNFAKLLKGIMERRML